VSSLLSVTYRLARHHNAVLSPLGAALLFSPDGASTLVFLQSVQRNKYGNESVSLHLPGPVEVGGLNARGPLSFFLWQHKAALAPLPKTSETRVPRALTECIEIFVSLHAVSEDTVREIVHLPLAAAVWDLLVPPMKSLAQARPWALNDALREALIGSCTSTFDRACIGHIMGACLAHPCGRSNVLAVLEATVYRCSRDTRIAQIDTERMAETFRSMVHAHMDAGGGAQSTHRRLT
jgi:hypothetical protein